MHTRTHTHTPLQLTDGQNAISWKKEPVKVCNCGHNAVKDVCDWDPGEGFVCCVFVCFGIKVRAGAGCPPNEEALQWRWAFHSRHSLYLFANLSLFRMHKQMQEKGWGKVLCVNISRIDSK